VNAVLTAWREAVAEAGQISGRNAAAPTAAKSLSRALCPAFVLKTIRDRSPVTVTGLVAEWGIRASSLPPHPANARRIEAILADLTTAGLIRLREGRLETTPLLATTQRALELSLGELADAHARAATDDAAELEAIIPAVAAATTDAAFREDLRRSLEELGEVIRAGCHIAAMCLAGKVLEICLKLRLRRAEVTYEERDTIGILLKRFREGPEKRDLDPALSRIGDIILKARNPAVHSTCEIPSPSREQALMVMRAVLDTLRRTFQLREAPRSGRS
jgi:hypothetical protein